MCTYLEFGNDIKTTRALFMKLRDGKLCNEDGTSVGMIDIFDESIRNNIDLYATRRSVKNVRRIFCGKFTDTKHLFSNINYRPRCIF